MCVLAFVARIYLQDGSAPWFVGQRKRVFKGTLRAWLCVLVDGAGPARGTWTCALGMRNGASFTTCSQCLATSDMISPAPCTMCQRCPCVRCWRKECVMPPQCRSNLRRDARVAPCSVPTVTTQNVKGVQHACVASGGVHGRRRTQPHPQRAGRVGDQHDQPEATRGCPGTQEAFVQVRVGLVFPVPADEPASLIPKGHGGWEVCVEGNSTFLSNFVRKHLLGNQCCEWGSTQQFKITQLRYTVCRQDDSNCKRNDQQRASQGRESLGREAGARALQQRLGRALWNVGLHHLDLRASMPFLQCRQGLVVHD